MDCVTYMRSILCDANVIELLKVAEKFDLKSLKSCQRLEDLNEPLGRETNQ